jgi:hypothetical protein
VTSDFEWMARAACLGVVDPMWDDSTPTPDALRFCFRCPVRRDCADYGLSRPYASDAGVLGGLGLYDRQRIRERVTTVPKVWGERLRDLVNADWDDALAEDYARRMPRLELV